MNGPIIIPGLEPMTSLLGLFTFQGLTQGPVCLYVVET
jgi:hypothetical protein